VDGMGRLLVPARRNLRVHAAKVTAFPALRAKKLTGSVNLTKRSKYSLNALAHDITIDLIKGVLKQGVNVQEVCSQRERLTAPVSLTVVRTTRTLKDLCGYRGNACHIPDPLAIKVPKSQKDYCCQESRLPVPNRLRSIHLCQSHTRLDTRTMGVCRAWAGPNPAKRLWMWIPV
jgi:hypothetical protein